MANLHLPIANKIHAFFATRSESNRPTRKPTYNDVFDLLRQRRDDPDFWTPLTEMLRELVRDAAAAEAATWHSIPQLKLLATWDADELAQRLRKALPQVVDGAASDSRSPKSSYATFVSEMSPGVLSAFLLLGLAAGCDSSPNSGVSLRDAGGTGGSTFVLNPTGGSNSVGGAEACNAGTQDGGTHIVADPSDAGLPPCCTTSSASSLWNTISESTLDDQAKRALFTCFEKLKSSWCDGLVALFKTGTPQQIAAELEGLLQCCDTGSPIFDSRYTADLQSRIIEGCYSQVILYKGVSFPPEDLSAQDVKPT